MASLETRFAESNIQIYPNPTSHLLNINFELNEYNQLWAVIDAFGKKVLSGRNDRLDVITLDVSGLPAGLYTFMLEESLGGAYMKFIKE